MGFLIFFSVVLGMVGTLFGIIATCMQLSEQSDRRELRDKHVPLLRRECDDAIGRINAAIENELTTQSGAAAARRLVGNARVSINNAEKLTQGTPSDDDWQKAKEQMEEAKALLKQVPSTLADVSNAQPHI